MSPSGQRVIHGWKPIEVLNLVNPEKCSGNKWTCPAQTQKKTRCLKTRDANSYIGASLIVDEMAIMDPATFLDNKDKLVKLAELTLCSANHRHGYKRVPGWREQISCVGLAVAEWVALISAYIAKKNDDFTRPTGSANLLSLKGDLGEEQRRRDSTLAVVRDETPSATYSGQYTSQHRAHKDIPIKLEESEARSYSTGGQALPQSTLLSLTLGASPVASDQLDLEAFKDLTLENDRLKTENSKLLNEFEKMKKKLARVERERQAMEKERDDLSNQVEELYEEINELADKVESLCVSS